MANRPRLDPGIESEVRAYIADLLRAEGEVTDAQRLLIAEMIDRSRRQVDRYVQQVREDLGIAAQAPPAPRDHDSAVDALLDRGSFTFADHEMKRLCLAYGGNLKALHRDAVALAGRLGLRGPVGYPQLTRKFNSELAANERGLIRRGIKGFKAASLYVRWSAPHRNEVWQIDATELDLWMMPKGTSTRTRPQALFIVDDYSRVILSASLLLHDYTAEDAAACVHRAMRMRQVTLPDGRVVEVGGRPDKILCDNAQQFTGQLMTHVALTLGFTMWSVAAYAGEQKGKVERVMRVANETWARQLPGYANKDIKTLSMRDHLHALDNQLLTEAELVDELGKFVEDWNHAPHPNFPNRSRYQVWADDDAGLHVVDERLLLPATVALPRPSYTYGKDGFRVQRDHHQRYYIDTTYTLDVGRRYMLRHLPGEPDWVDAYDLDGKHLVRCWDTNLIDHETAKQVEVDRRNTYRQLASARSQAVELRALAAARSRDTDLAPNHVAVAHQDTKLRGGNALIRRSLGLSGGDTPELANPDTTSDRTPRHKDPDTTPDDLRFYDDLAAEAIGADDEEQRS
jgi:hypothetical protein